MTDEIISTHFFQKQVKHENNFKTMADIIKLLPDHIANQIAAGEVIQRPASVIKELIENSIDAGSDSISVFVKDAGRTSIQLVDNGKGMSFMDARMAFERHATSKIASADDLFALNTKGFRGEALASIAAIAHVVLKTKRNEDELGSLIQIEGSTIVKQEPVQCPVGSSFEVKNLFFNVPARRNFLKSDNVEWRHIIDEFERVALAHPEIAFRLVHNDQEIFNLTKAAQRKRIVDIFGKAFNDKLVPINETTDIVRIEGFVGKPEAAKKSRGEQFFFVNNRFFKDTYFNHAVTAAFEQLLPAKMFPSYFIFLEINPKNIDVNVHPTKTEIKFEDDKAIYSILRSTIRLGLGKFNISPTLDFDRENEFDIPLSMKNQPAYEPVIQVDKNYNPFAFSNTREGQRTSSNSNSAFSQGIKNAGFQSDTNKSNWDDFWNPENEIASIDTANEQVALHEISPEIPEGPFFIKSSFIVSPVQSGLLLIHFRRAYERILYDELMRGFFINPLGSQQLLFPLEKNVSKQEQIHWNEHQKTLERIGFSWSWENEQLQLIGIPELLNESTVISCVDKILESIQMGELDKGEIAHTVLAQLAFAGSITFKLGNEPTIITDFVQQLFAAEEHTYTPNGKQIMSIISNEFLMQLF